MKKIAVHFVIISCVVFTLLNVTRAKAGNTPNPTNESASETTCPGLESSEAFSLPKERKHEREKTVRDGASLKEKVTDKLVEKAIKKINKKIEKINSKTDAKKQQADYVKIGLILSIVGLALLILGLIAYPFYLVGAILLVVGLVLLLLALLDLI
ncbi:MAG: hypothetical protein NZ529_04775 [Cytophagaceae bacterium]|nr:hypothetical protein [Cytophagaceae bacterium]MDW8456090.1 hypothetical protein [Cytophagaceae bacterium]